MSTVYEPSGSGLEAGDLEDLADIDPEPVVLQGQTLDPPGPGKPSLFDAMGSAKRSPITPGWAADWKTFTASVAFFCRHAGFLAAFHVTRVPLYAVKALGYAPLGLWRVLVLIARFVGDAEARPLRQDAADKKDPAAYMTLVRERNARIRRRWKGIGYGAGVVAALVGAAYVVLPVWVFCLGVVGAVVALAVYGSPRETPFVPSAVVRVDAPQVTSAAIGRALGGIGVPALTRVWEKGDTAKMFTTGHAISRVRNGWLATLDLPHGVTAQEVAEKREKLASGLRRPVGSVWPEGDRDQHEGRLCLYVLDKPMSQLPQPAWPLAKSGKADVFAPLPFGYDQRGELVTVPLMYSNLLVGAIPRQGKTFAVRVVVLAAALDPSVELHVHELKGTGDLDCVESSCHRYGSGAGDPDTLNAVMASIREVHAQLDTRAKAIKAAGSAHAPEKKVTRNLADTVGGVLRPVLLVIDEVQELFESAHAADAEDMLKAVIKRGPALGIMLVLSTQRPDKQSLPTGISSNMGHRLCLRVTGQIENDLILGTSAYKAGMRATTFTDADLGVGLLRTGGVSATTVRSCYIDAPTADRIGKRAHALRVAAGTLTGHALGEEPTTVNELDIAADVLSVWHSAGGDDSAWIHRLQDELAVTFPDQYGTLEGDWLGPRLRALKIPTQPQRKRMINGAQVNRAGVKMDALAKVLEHLDR